MIRSIRNENTVKVRSQELQIPFAHLASAFAIEEFLIRLAKSEYQNYLWLKNAGNLGLERYRRKLVWKLEFFYKRNPTLKEAAGQVPGQVLSEELLEVMMAELCSEDMHQGMTWKWNIHKQEKDYGISLTFALETMQIPLSITIENLENEKIQPYDLSLRLVMSNNNQIVLHQYPLEYIVADCMFEILNKLELINEISVYQRLFAIIKKEALDGRRIQQQLHEKCTEYGLNIDHKRLEMIKTYRNYTYMKKKWKSYLKAENKKVPAWEEVIDAVTAFITPIWEMMTRDMIFIGDWMPELLRFLD